MFAGIRSFSFVDVPDYVSAVLFTQGCNMRCPWCHNHSIAYSDAKEQMSIEQIFKQTELLRKRVDAICITGGEPTIHKDLTKVIEYLKNTLKYYVKLDTNGTNPQMLSELTQKKLIDYCALEIKAAPENYQKLTGTPTDFSKILQTVDILRKSDLEYELRMTYVPGLSSKYDIDFFKKLLEEKERAYITVAQSTDIYTVSSMKELIPKRFILR
ncbi:MAG TPA: anaerobic ribonucleoside-triphosphate reductase activating protein [Petrotogaceae bacterium]|nr:anaerobic ribonucleoside-triphosphate reductase activating protein [Petrotogaceae bacterium]